VSGNTIWQSGDSLNPTNMNNQTVSSLTILGTFSAGTVSSQSVVDLEVGSTFSSQGTSILSGTWSSFISASGVSTSVLTATTATITTGTVTNISASTATITTSTVTNLTASSTISSAGTTKVNVVWASDVSAAALKSSVITVDSGTSIVYTGGVLSTDAIGGFFGAQFPDDAASTPTGWLFYSEQTSGNVNNPAGIANLYQYNAADAHTGFIYPMYHSFELNGDGTVTTVEAFNLSTGLATGSTGNVTTMRGVKVGAPYELGSGSVGTFEAVKVSDLDADHYVWKSGTGIADFTYLSIDSSAVSTTGSVVLKTGQIDSDATIAAQFTTTTQSGAPTGLMITHSHNTSSSGGPVGAGFYVTGSNSADTIAAAYAVDLSYNHAGAGHCATARSLEVWGGVDTGGGRVDNFRMIELLDSYDVPGTSIGTMVGIQIGDMVGNTASYALYTGKGIVRIGDALSLTSATNLPSNISGTGYLYADSASSLYWVNGSGVSTLLA
jgi:hypothetical protein